jgi:sulfatase modifying factor 1
MRGKTRITSLFVIFIASQLFAQGNSQFKNSNGNKFNRMVLIPASTFQMGCDSSDMEELAKMGEDVPHMNLGHALWWFADETPKHMVHVDSFYIDAYEVTNEQFKKFVDATGYKAEGDWEKYATPDRMNHPVVNVTWNDASTFAKWAGKRLPTEAEWEYAAKGGTNFKWFWWGDKPDPTKANYRSQGESFFAGVWRLLGLRKIGTKPVGSYGPNGFGLYDMIGNVSEWCQDIYKPYPGNNSDNDKFNKGLRVVRGGNWESPNPVFIRIPNRHGVNPKSFSYNRGFRCVKPVR